MPSRPKRRLRRSPPSVRPHASGAWTVSIGKVPDKTKSKLRPKDWYFQGTEAAANEAARKIAERWAFIVRNWAKLNQPTLTAIDAPFADEPHWLPAFNQKDEPSGSISDATIEAFSNVAPTENEISEIHDAIRLHGVSSLWKLELARRIADGDKGKSTTWTDEKNVRCCMRFFDENMRLEDLTTNDIRNAKSAILTTKARRTADNYLSAFKRMLSWFYNSEYGGVGWDRPVDFDNVFTVTNATNTNVKIPTIADLKLILDHANDQQRLYAMLALNCGMYPGDIGRLTLEEINLSEGYIFWDREKQPGNQLKVRHDLWAETRKLVRQFIQPAGTAQRYFTDFRGRKNEPTQVDCSTLAFVDAAGNPLYCVRESGKAYDKLAKPWQALNQKLKDEKYVKVGYQFHNLRKATNQVLKNLLQSKVDGDDRGQLIAIQEISDMFLAHKSTELVRVYETLGVNGYVRMNRYLAEVGDALRKADVFKRYASKTMTGKKSNARCAPERRAKSTTGMKKRK